MSIDRTASPPNFRNVFNEHIQDPVSLEPMTRAVVLVPCGHSMDEDNAVQFIARRILCPICRGPIEKYTPNFAVRGLVEAASQPHDDDEPSEEAKNYFEQGKAFSEQNDYENAVSLLLEALQRYPRYEKAQAYLDFCLARSSEPKPEPSLSENPKEGYLNLLFSYMDNSQIKALPILIRIFENQIDDLMGQEGLTPIQQESFKWAQRLYTNNKVSDFVAGRLESLHRQSLGQSSRSPTESPSPDGFSSPQPTPMYFSPPPPSGPGGPRPPTEPRALRPSPPGGPGGSRLPPPRGSTAPGPPSSGGSYGGILPLYFQPTMQSAIPPTASGKAKWEKYFGNVGVEPSLPPDIHQILNAPCPFWPDKKVHETHLLTLIPRTVNGQPFTLDSLGELIQKPLGGGKVTQYSGYWDELKKEYGNIAPAASYWVLMTKDVIPVSRGKTYDAQKQLLATYNQKSQLPYEIPHLLEAATGILMEHVQSGTRLYSDNLWTYTRCQERVSSNPNLPLVVGGFAAGGLVVRSNFDVEIEIIGVGGCRKF